MTNSTGTIGLVPRNVAPLEYTGSPLNFVPITGGPRDPTTADTKYNSGCEWINTITLDTWKLYGFISGAANWKKLASGSIPGGTVVSLSDTSATVVMPDGTGNIQLVGGTGVTVTSTPASNLLTIAIGGGSPAVESLTGDSGGAITAVSNNINIKGQSTPSVSGIKVLGTTGELDIEMFSPFVGNFEFKGTTAGTAEQLKVITPTTLTQHPTHSYYYLLAAFPAAILTRHIPSQAAAHMPQVLIMQTRNHGN